MKNILIITFVCLWAVHIAPAATTYDLGDDWETGSPLGGDPNGVNPNGPWEYGHQSVLGTEAFTRYDNFIEADAFGDGSWYQAWDRGAVSAFPYIAHSYNLVTGSGWYIGATVVQTYGYQNTEHATVRWTAPSEGLLNIDINVAPLPGYPEPSAVVALKSAMTDPNSWIIYSDIASSLSYNWTGHHIQAGDTIDLVIAGTVGNSANYVDMAFELYAIGEPNAPAENNIPNPIPSLPPFDPNDPDAVWDLSRQYNPTTNPGTYWSYGWGSTLDEFNLYNDTWGDADYQGWYDPVGTVDPLANGPLIYKYTGGFHLPNDVSPQDVVAHSGPSLLTKARWTSPIDDFVSITGVASAGAYGNVDVYVVKDGSEILVQALSAASDVPIDTAAFVVPGTTIDIVVGPSPDNIFGDTTPLKNIQITRTEVTCPYIEHLATDFNNDCYVNLEDFALFAQDWLKCNDPLDPTCTDVP